MPTFVLRSCFLCFNYFSAKSAQILALVRNGMPHLDIWILHLEYIYDLLRRSINNKQCLLIFWINGSLLRRIRSTCVYPLHNLPFRVWSPSIIMRLIFSAAEYHNSQKDKLKLHFYISREKVSHLISFGSNLFSKRIMNNKEYLYSSLHACARATKLVRWFSLRTVNITADVDFINHDRRAVHHRPNFDDGNVGYFQRNETLIGNFVMNKQNIYYAYCPRSSDGRKSIQNRKRMYITRVLPSRELWKWVNYKFTKERVKLYIESLSEQQVSSMVFACVARLRVRLFGSKPYVCDMTLFTNKSMV